MKEESLRDLSDEQVSGMLAYLTDQMEKSAKVINVEPIRDTDCVSVAPDQE
jgi:hypothetical protein